MSLTPLAGGLRMITCCIHPAARLDGNSAFRIHLGNIESIIKPISITTDQGYVVDIEECIWKNKLPLGPAYRAVAALLDPNELYIVVRAHPAPIGADGYPHSKFTEYKDLTAVNFQIVAIVH